MADNVKITTNLDQLVNNIALNIDLPIQEALKNQALDYYANRTEEQKLKILSAYKTGFEKYKIKLQTSDSLQDYFQAYEYILEFRKFILGQLGIINYTFVLSSSQRGSTGSVFVKSITIKSEDFKNLIMDNNSITGLVKFEDNLRFSSAFISKLRKLIKDIKQQGVNIGILPSGNEFIIQNETLGTRQTFTNGQLFKSRIDFLQRQYQTQHWYHFDLNITKDISANDQRAVFKYQINKVTGNPLSSSVFSAIGKYFSDEMTAKREAVKNSVGINIDPSYPNVGNLTQLYALAKQRLNNGHNNFYPRRKRVSGMTLFELWNEVRANTEPFYSGGDLLMEQIKSFLGSNPSLTSYTTIKKTIQNFYNAISISDIQEMKNRLSKLLLQNNSNLQLISKQEKNLSKAIAKSFNDFFKNLTN